jgi:hypothetical protein
VLLRARGGVGLAPISTGGTTLWPSRCMVGLGARDDAAVFVAGVIGFISVLSLAVVKSEVPRCFVIDCLGMKRRSPHLYGCIVGRCNMQVD